MIAKSPRNRREVWTGVEVRRDWLFEIRVSEDVLSTVTVCPLTFLTMVFLPASPLVYLDLNFARGWFYSNFKVYEIYPFLMKRATYQNGKLRSCKDYGVNSSRPESD